MRHLQAPTSGKHQSAFFSLASCSLIATVSALRSLLCLGQRFPDYDFCDVVRRIVIQVLADA